jgi:hypothetical protein
MRIHKLIIIAFCFESALNANLLTDNNEPEKLIQKKEVCIVKAEKCGNFYEKKKGAFKE